MVFCEQAAEMRLSLNTHTPQGYLFPPRCKKKTCARRKTKLIISFSITEELFRFIIFKLRELELPGQKQGNEAVKHEKGKKILFRGEKHSCCVLCDTSFPGGPRKPNDTQPPLFINEA